MKFIIVEDDRNKRLFLEFFFKQNGDEYYSFQSVKPAIKFAINNSTEINGIILDLALTSYDYTDDYEYDRGLEMISELIKNGIYIPVLINSSVYVRDLKKFVHNRFSLL